MSRVLHPLLLVFARVTHHELARMVQYLKSSERGSYRMTLANASAQGAIPIAAFTTIRSASSNRVRVNAPQYAQVPSALLRPPGEH